VLLTMYGYGQNVRVLIRAVASLVDLVLSIIVLFAPFLVVYPLLSKVICKSSNNNNIRI
jgi:hypothetical protein